MKKIIAIIAIILFISSASYSSASTYSELVAKRDSLILRSIQLIQQEINDLSSKILGKKTYGTAIPNSPALVDTYLSAGITASANSLTLASGVTNDGTTLTGFMCFTIDVNTPQVEYVCGTASSTLVTGITRGVDMTNPNATTTHAYAHRRFSSIQSTDYPAIQFIQRKLNGLDTLDSKLTYGPSITIPSLSGQDLAPVNYVNSIAFTGSPNGSLTVKGIYQEATKAQTASSTASGSTGADLIVPNSYFSASSTATTTIPVTLSNGKLDQGFIDFTQPFTFSGNTTLSTTTVQGKNVFAGLSKFGGTGVDGALTISSGTTTINLGGLPFVTKNYSSISITGTGVLSFSNPAANGTVIVLKSTSDVTITSSSTNSIDLRGIGATSTTNSGSALQPATTVQSYFGAAGLTAGIQYLLPQLYYANGITNTYPHKSVIITPGSGGGSPAPANSGIGGAGGGALYIEAGGALNFSASSTINASGQNGTNATAPTSGGGAGGGGAGGMVTILANTITTNSGTINTAGGGGGNNQTGNTGAGGGGAGSLYAAGGAGGSAANGSGAAGNSAGGGGAGNDNSIARTGGGGGASSGGLVMVNTEF